MSALSKAESAYLKAFVTRPVEPYRRSYGRKQVIQPRRCVFIGATNQAAYLKDGTGDRRFWPVKVGTIDTDALTRDRDQLFAEAVASNRDETRWWSDQAFEAEHIAPEQYAQLEVDAWTEPIREYSMDKSAVLIGAIARHTLSLETLRLGTAEKRRIAGIMTTLV